MPIFEMFKMNVLRVCESKSPRVESASRVCESSQRVGESPVSPGSKIHTVLFEFLGTFFWTLFWYRDESRRVETTSRDNESSRRVETASRRVRKNPNFRSDLGKKTQKISGPLAACRYMPKIRPYIH